VCHVIDAYILIQTQVGKAAIVPALVRTVPGVSEATSVVGSYDVVARARAPDTKDLAELVTAQIRAIASVNRTTTCTVLDRSVSRSRPETPDCEHDQAWTHRA